MKNLYVIFDKISGTSSDPFTALNDGVAIRAFRQQVGGCPYPEDFNLLQIGTVQENGTVITPLEQVEIVQLGSDVLKKEAK